MIAKRLSLALTGLVLVATSVTFTGATRANACIADGDHDCYMSVRGTVESASLNVRSAPWGAVIDNLPNGYTGTVDCYVQASDGSYWDWLYDSQIGRSGWVYDPYLYTGGNINTQVDELSEGNCGTIPLMIPGNVRATATGTSAIRVTWSDTNSGSAQYVVSNGNVSSATLAAGTTSYTWGGLAPSEYMCFEVAAKESGGQSAWTSYACTTTWPLRTPSTVTAVATSTTSIHVSWADTNGGGSQYVVSNGDVSSADLPAGTTSYNWTGLIGGEFMCFAVAAKQSGGQSAWSPDACATTPSYVNMGDSFASGEGTYGPYTYLTNTPANKCHRSPNSFAGQYAAMSAKWNTVDNIACSGAVTADIVTAPGKINSMGIPTALEAAQVNALSARTGLVTVTIGGNNLNLVGIFTNCLTQGARDHDKTDSCFVSSFSDAFIAGIAGLVPTLEATYQSIRDAAPNARIVVSTYPQTFPKTYTTNCTEGIGNLDLLYLITSQNQLTRIRAVVSALNNAIKTAAAAEGFTVLDVENLFAGHEMCSSSSWVNEIKNYLPPGSPDDESLHPTTAGYAAWAGALKSFLGG